MKLIRTLMNRSEQTADEEKRLMLEMENIGKKIASLRKQSNRTQQDLADQLGVTYQAVSNWERGLSIPDVVRLKDLARLFEISLDELLGSEEATRVVEVATGDRSAGTVRELLDSAPYMKPQTLEKEIKARTTSRNEDGTSAAPQADPAPSSPVQDPSGPEPHGSSQPDVDAGTDPATNGQAPGQRFPSELQDIHPGGPGEESLQGISESQEDPRNRSAHDSTAGCTSDAADPSSGDNADHTSGDTADHTSGDTADHSSGDTAESDSEQISFREILAFAPFISSDLIHELVQQEMDSDPDFDYGVITPLAPFLEQEHLQELTHHFLQQSPANAAISEQTLLSLLPHLDQSTLAELAEHAMVSDQTNPNILIQLAPFLDQETLGRFVLASDDRTRIPDTTILGLAPFLDSHDLRALAAKREPLSLLLRTSLMPFLHDDDMESVVRDLFNRKDRKSRE